MNDHGSPHPPRSGPTAAAIVLAIVFLSFTAWWFVTDDSDIVTAAPFPAAVTLSDTVAPAR